MTCGRWISFDSIKLTLGSSAGQYADYFETCRRKRNVIDYTRSHVATETEAVEILQEATEFYEVVEAWIDTRSSRRASTTRRATPGASKLAGRA